MARVLRRLLFTTDRLGGTEKEVKRKVKIFLGRGKTWDLLGKTGLSSACRQRACRPVRPSVRSRQMKLTDDQWKTARGLYLTGSDWGTIADKLGAKKATLQKRAEREGLTKLRREAKSISLTDISVKTEKSLEALSALVRSKLAADAASTLERIDSYSLDGIKDESVRESILGSVAKRSALVFGWSEQGEQASVSINLLGSMPDRSVEISVSNEAETK